MHPHFGDRLAQACKDKNSFVCVGLDPRWESLPETIKSGVDENNWEAVAGATQCYCQEVVDAIAEYSPVVKPQAAFFERLGPHGMVALWGVIQHARKAGLLVLLDGKRGDIGSTAAGYAAAYLGEETPWKCDALTVNPYLGQDTLVPFAESAEQNGAGIFVLVKTSNEGSGFLQDLSAKDKTGTEAIIYERVARQVESMASARKGQSGMGSIGAVVGATYPEQLSQLRASMPSSWILIPGFGAQGGTAENVRHGFASFNGHSTGAIVNSSRGIIFAYQNASSGDWQTAVAKAACEMRDQLRSVV